MTSHTPAMPGATYELNDHFEQVVYQRLGDDHIVGKLQQELCVLAENYEGGACRSGNHVRYRVLMHELTTKDVPKSLFTDASSCADLLVAIAHAVNGTKDSVHLGLDAMCTIGGVTGLVLEEHPHNVLGMIRTIAEVPRTTSTAMSSRSHSKFGQIMPAATVHGSWYQFLAMRIFDKDMCFDRYVRVYLKNDSGINMCKSTCNLAGVGWEDVRNWYNKN
ncbi:MAG: hypothetical protein J3R72DRAFT_421234 [Linnemannia gamsii]|nr:MAG: hypothetical protein J3R72DRAFT_421234 [Linnemannia gamsii]